MSNSLKIKKMKTRIPIIVIVVLSMVVIIPQTFASCIVNEDWPEAPCLDTIGNGWYDQDEVDKWSNYYSYKGANFMEKKFFQLDTAIAEDRLEQWANESPVNRNVYEYYFFSGRAPNIGWHNAQFHIFPINENPADKRDFTFLDSVITTSPDFDIEIAFLVTTPDDCHGKKDGSNWEWIDQECVLSDPPADYKTIPRKYFFAAPLKQIKAGVAMTDIQCNDGKNVVYKRDKMRAACVTAETENQLIFDRKWASMRLGMPAQDDQGPNLCDWYGGMWDSLPRLCHGLKYPLLCSMSGGDITESSCFIPSTTGIAPVASNHVDVNESDSYAYEDLCGFPVTDEMRLKAIYEQSHRFTKEGIPFFELYPGNFTHITLAENYGTNDPHLNYWFDLENGKQTSFRIAACDLDGSSISRYEKR